VLDVVALQAARRLVHEDDARARGDGAADLDDLLRRDRQMADDPVRLQLGVGEAPEHVERERLGLGAPEDAGAGRLAAEEDVLRHGQMRAERQLLVDQRDAALTGVVGRGRLIRLSR
jgi:hypothetical protein